MTKNHVKPVFLLIALVNLVFSSASAQQKIAAGTKKYLLELKKSRILWNGPKSIGHRHQGFIYFSSGDLTEISPNRYGTANFVIDMNSILTLEGKEEKNSKNTTAMLKNVDFFDAKKFPTAKMKVKKIEATSTAFKYKVTGDLTIKGITNPIDFIATIKKNKGTVTALATFMIDRKKWGINFKKSTDAFSFIKDKMLADEIPVSLDLLFISI